MKFLFVPIFIFSIVFNSFSFVSPPDEGMWLPLLLKDYNYAEMQRLGLKLTVEQIYDINQSCLKDAIVQLGGFCTAEVISKEGLILTNHHCGYDAIATSSSEEHNYLKDGFWAMNRSQEIPVEGLSIKFLIQMIDVSDRIAQLEVQSDEFDAELAVAEEIQKIQQELSESDKYIVTVESMFDGNAHYAFVYQQYTDIRLVGAPPSSIGKFGGDTDNWMWPRHTGDFSMFRIYAANDNSPAEYSQSNIPYVPKYALPISTKGLNEGDFTMVMGYPGSTDRYLTSSEIKSNQEITAPVLVDILGQRLSIMKTEMDKNATTQLNLASNYASLSNSRKYYEGQLLGLKKFDFLSKKKVYESELQSWIEKDDERKSTYGTLLKDMAELEEKNSATNKNMLIINVAGFAPGIITAGIRTYRLHQYLSDDDHDVQSESAQSHLEILKEASAEYFSENNSSVERNMLILALRSMKDKMSADAQMDLFNSPLFLKKAKGSIELYADFIMSKSILANEDLMSKFLAKPSFKSLDKDPGVLYINSLIKLFREKVNPQIAQYNAMNDKYRKMYTHLLFEKEQKNFYPDANFTMRLTYGTVASYKNWDGKAYETFTYAEEILDKYKAGDDEFDVPEKLRTLIKNKDYGAYANDKGKLNVCFVHNTDITGGNSGSPVINENGELVGCAFDGNWESMTSDLFWQDEYVRTISVDIRYVLFIIDKFAGASHLIDEMNLVK